MCLAVKRMMRAFLSASESEDFCRSERRCDLREETEDVEFGLRAHVNFPVGDRRNAELYP